jgi:hypothetical protein
MYVNKPGLYIEEQTLDERVETFNQRQIGENFVKPVLLKLVSGTL